MDVTVHSELSREIFDLNNKLKPKVKDVLLEIAKNLGFKRIFATTKEDCIIKRAERHGFRLSKEKVILKEIES